MHSVTSSPVSSKWTPPRMRAAARRARRRCARPRAGSRRSRASYPPEVVIAVAVHRIADPQDPPSCAPHRLDQGGQSALDRARAHPGDEDDLARLVVRVQPLDELARSRPAARRADLDPDRVRDAAEELDVGAVEGAGPLAD